MNEVTIKIHAVAEGGLPNMENLTGRVAFIFDGCIVSGWPAGREEEGDQVWETDSDVGTHRPLIGVTHWVEFPVPVWELERQ